MDKLFYVLKLIEDDSVHQPDNVEYTLTLGKKWGEAETRAAAGKMIEEAGDIAAEYTIIEVYK